MRFFRNLLLTLLCIAAIGSAAVYGYFQFRGNREKELLGEGLAQMEQGNYRSALDRFVQARKYENQITRYLSDDPLEEDLFKYSAICDFHLGNLDEAAQIYDRMLKIHPRDPSLMESLACVYAAQGRIGEAAALFDQAIAIDYKNYSRIYTAALILREYGDGEGSAKYFKRLLEEHGDEIDNLTRGQALCLLGRYEEAVEVLGRVENPDMETAFLYAAAKEYTGAHEEALSLLLEYEEQIAAYPEMLDLKGTALCALGRCEEALSCFEQALPLSQKGTALRRSILYNRIAALESLRRFEEAKKLAAEYAELYPDDRLMERENLFLQTR